MTNASCTIYHKSYDKVSRLDVWSSIQYPAVAWRGKQAASVSPDGLSTADVYTVRVPTTDEIVVAPGDWVVQGLVDDAITGPAQLTAKYQNCFVVTAARDNRYGSSVMHHWRLEGK